MDSTVVDIKFEKYGVCNYCMDFLNKNDSLNKQQVRLNDNIDSLLNTIKIKGKNLQYDCIVGVSGGVDSSWVLVQAVRNGLRPLVVHMDNGWNSELAQSNITNLLEAFSLDLHTHVIEWNEYRTLMQAFFDADVVDVELLYDNAMLAVNYKLAEKFKIKYILSGDNTSTEGMRMPPGWNWLKFDKKNIEALAQRVGLKKLKTFPSIGTFDYFYYEFILGIKWVKFLDYIQYNKNDALNELEKIYGYKRYPYKHYESIFTRFYQGYILPKKFGIDKRLLHLSNLIITSQMSREEAIELLNNIPYPSEKEQNSDVDYFLKKMNWSKKDLETYLIRPPIPHDNYKSEISIWRLAKKIHGAIRKYN
jgi:N-acetyl sugar amidotransferase